MSKINLDNIEISDKLDKCIHDAIDEGYKKAKTKKQSFYKIASAVFLIGIMGIGFMNSEFVHASIEKIKNSLGDFAIERNFVVDDEHKIEIGETIEDKRIKVTLNECYIDDNKLMFITTLDSRERSDYAQGIEPKVYINGKLMDVFKNNYLESINHNDNGTVSLLSSFSLEGIDIGGDLNIIIDYDTVETTNILDMDRQIKGKWKFEFNIDNSQIDKRSIYIDINKTIMIDDCELKIKSIKIMPYRIELICNGVDSKELHGHVHYVIKDNNDNEYIDSSGRGNNDTMTLEYLIDTTDIKSIMIIPRTDFYNSEPEMHYDKAIKVDIK